MVASRALQREQPITVDRQVAWLLAYGGAALIILGVLALQTHHFSGRNYRDDEIRTVHAGMTMSVPEVVQWMSTDIHPPLWRVSGTVWVSLFGPDERVVRFESALYTALALAFMYRLAADLFGARVGLLAVLVLGAHSLFLFYAHEFRPYAALLLWVIALHWAFLRWLRRPHFSYAALYVLFCAAALYTHFFALYAVAGQVAAFLLLVRLNGVLYLRAFGLWVLAGLSFAGWLPSFLHSFLAAQPGGIEYGLPLNDPGTPGVLYGSLNVRPLALGNLLLAVGVLSPFVGRTTASLPFPLFHKERGGIRQFAHMRFGGWWRVGYVVIGIVVVLLLTVFTDLTITNVLTQRNLIIIVPLLALLAALGLRALPWQAALIAIVLMLNPAVTEFIDYQRNQPYREVYDAIETNYAAGSPIVVSVDSGTGSYFTYAYYLMDRMPGRIDEDDFFHMSAGQPQVNLPDTLPNHITDDSSASLARFRDLIESAEQVWWISGPEAPAYIETYREALEAEFVLEAQHNFESYERTYTVDEYRRIEDVSSND